MAWDMYQEVILQHYRNPHNFGPLADATREGEESNPLCGDHITLRLKVDPATQRIGEVRFEGDGCAISVASTSMLTDRLVGRTVDEAGQLTRDDVLQQLGIPLSPARIKCALTGFAALGKALHPEATAAAT
ncbi:MAG TPA: SUF system NifU family Fe-S cluster assembly protein [Thermoplasmata archaeon]|jgi:nitrogen fixation protein NifU and related proteins|nr:SUF system NifU family Fe-S cluster assembly protein [Thermoplasmata archaeon]